MADHLELGVLTIYLPTGSNRDFWWMQDLTELTGVETNEEAQRSLEQALARRRGHKPKGRIELDHEADAVIVHTSNAASMVHVVEALRAIADPARLSISDADVAQAAAVMAKHRRPKPTKWQLGDVFAIPLGDGTFTFGQVVGLGNTARSPTCALFELRAPAPNVEVMEVITARTLTIVHTIDSDLADGEWPIVGAAPIVVDPSSGRQGPASAGRSYTGFAAIAVRYWGLEPWNDCADEDWFDSLLLPGVTRPSTVWMLTNEQRAWLLDAYKAREPDWPAINARTAVWRSERDALSDTR